MDFAPLRRAGAAAATRRASSCRASARWSGCARSPRTPAGHDAGLWRSFAEAGWLGVLVPETQGGAGLGLLDAAVLLHELGRARRAGAVPRVVGRRASWRSARAGSRAQQELWLPRLAAGEAIATLALFEGAEPRLEGAALRDRAARRAGGFLLDGAKLFVEYGAARGPRARGVPHRAAAGRAATSTASALFAVPGGARGLKKEPLVSVDETRRSAELRFRGVALPREALLAGRGRAAATRRARSRAPSTPARSASRPRASAAPSAPSSAPSST